MSTNFIYKLFMNLPCYFISSLNHYLHRLSTFSISRKLLWLFYRFCWFVLFLFLLFRNFWFMLSFLDCNNIFLFYCLNFRNQRFKKSVRLVYPFNLLFCQSFSLTSRDWFPCLQIIGLLLHNFNFLSDNNFIYNFLLSLGIFNFWLRNYNCFYFFFFFRFIHWNLLWLSPKFCMLPNILSGLFIALTT